MEDRNKHFLFDERRFDSPYIEAIWRTESSGGGGKFISIAEVHWGMVISQEGGKTLVTIRGAETSAKPAGIPEGDTEFFGIIFKLGTFMPIFPVKNLVDDELNLPESTNQSFWLDSAAWELPTFDNADIFVNRLVKAGLLARDPIVDSVLNGGVEDLSLRSVQRRFLNATGLSHNTVQQIKRAQAAAAMLEQGKPILDTVFDLGYFDQPHLTKSLKRFLGRTPAQFLPPEERETAILIPE